MLTTPQAFLFDWDNTLVDTWPIIHRALYDTFMEYGMEPWTLKQVKERVGRSMREAFPDLFGKKAEAAGESYSEYYRRYQLEWLKPHAGAMELLATLRSLPVMVAVVSNKRSEFLRKEIAHLGWEHYFDAIVGAGDAEHDKPHPAPARMALAQVGIGADPSVWFIGDSDVDLECANAAGLSAVLYGELIEAEHDAEKHFYRGWGYHAYAPDHATLQTMVDATLAK